MTGAQVSIGALVRDRRCLDDSGGDDKEEGLSEKRRDERPPSGGPKCSGNMVKDEAGNGEGADGKDGFGPGVRT